MGKARVKEAIDIAASIELVFERLADHEAMSEWPGVRSCRLTTEGNPRNGLGAVREIKVSGLTLLEEVVHYEPPVRYDYKIIKGLPVDHLGTVRLVPNDDGGVRVTWEVNMSSGWPLVCGAVGRGLAAGLPKSLAYVKAEIERAAA